MPSDSASEFIPAEHIPMHNGEPRPAWMEFFAQPPAEIGELISAESTLKQGRRAWTLGGRAALTAVISAVAWGLMAWLQDYVNGRSNEVHIPAWAAVIVAVPTVLYFTRFIVRCTYVGRDGIARYTLSGSRRRKPRGEGMLFVDATELRAKQTRQFVNGVYNGTVYDFSWFGVTGARRFKIASTYRNRDGNPRARDPFHFARSAERVWSAHFLQRAQGQLQSEGSIAFRVSGEKIVRVGPGFIEFHFGQQPQRVTRDEIASVSLGQGWFSFKHRDAKWYSLSGRYKFQYGNMGNGQVFLLALDRLMGYRWEDRPRNAA